MSESFSAIVRHAVFPLWAWLDHPRYRAYAKEFERSQFLPTAALQALQLQRLGRLLAHAYQRCPFYRQRMDRAGFRPSDLTSFGQISRLPVLKKKDIQDHGNDLAPADWPDAARVRNQTGGSTGSPLQFYVDRERFDSRLASTVRHNRWAGLRPGDWCAELWGARLDQVIGRGVWDWLRNVLLYRTIELNTSRIQPGDFARFVTVLRRKRLRFLVAYTQCAVLFARYLQEQGIDDIHFDSIITTAEVLLPGQRELLEETFRGRVFDRYGCREVSVIASECEGHTGLHVNAEALFVEVVPDPTIPPPAGKVVVTDLFNYSMPFIRYEIGDVARWAENQECPCGRGLPLLEDLQGRITDFLILPDGRKVSGPSLTLVVSDMPDVRQVQFVQKSRDAVTLRVVRGYGYGPMTAAELQRRLSLYLQGVARMEIEEVESIPTMASGKYRFVVNEFQSQTVGPSDALEGTRA